MLKILTVVPRRLFLEYNQFRFKHTYLFGNCEVFTLVVKREKPKENRFNVFITYKQPHFKFV